MKEFAVSSLATPEELTVSVSGRISVDNASAVEEAILAQRSAHPEGRLTLDAQDLTYISSAGLRVIIRLLKGDSSLSIVNASSEVYDVFDMTGITQMVDVRRAMPTLSVDGLQLIGAGANGRVYRLDSERIVKVYNPKTNPPEKIFREKQVARQAFIAGIPSAMSFEMVRVGDGYGIVYEMIDATTLGEAIGREPERLEEYAVRMAELLRELHATEFAPGTLPDARLSLHAWVDVAERSGYYDAEVIAAAHRLVDSIPERNTFVHGDFHPANIMVTDDDELLLIDMGDASMGDPVIDLLGSYQIMHVVPSQPGGAERYTGLSSEQLLRVWDVFLRSYLGTNDPEQIEAIQRKLHFYVLIRSLPGVTFSELVPEEKRGPYTAVLGNEFLKGMAALGL